MLTPAHPLWPCRELQRRRQVQNLDETPVQQLRQLPGGADGPRVVPGQGEFRAGACQACPPCPDSEIPI